MSSKKVKILKDRVEECLKAKGMSQRKLAQIINKDYKYMNACISEGVISESIMLKIGQALDVTPDYLSGDFWEPYEFSFYFTAVKYHDGDMAGMMNDLVNGLIHFSELHYESKEAMKLLSGEQKKKMMFSAIHASDRYYTDVICGKDDNTGSDVIGRRIIDDLLSYCGLGDRLLTSEQRRDLLKQVNIYTRTFCALLKEGE